jgi:hypothetical protein
VEQARKGLEVSQDLTVSDYFALYHAQIKSRDAMVDVAKRMAPEEVAELLLAYQKLSTGETVAEHSIVPMPRFSPVPELTPAASTARSM